MSVMNLIIPNTNLSMSNLVLGRKIYVMMKISGVYTYMFCGKTVELTTDIDPIETTSPDSPNAREYEAGLEKGEIVVTGVQTSDNTNGRVSPYYLLQESVKRFKQDFKYVYTDQNNVTRAIQFFGLITNNSLTRDINSWGQCSVTLLVSGGISFEDPISPSGSLPTQAIRNDWWVTVPGQTYVAVGSVAGSRNGYTMINTDDVKFIGRSGTQDDEVGGTPGNRQAHWNPATLRIEVDPAVPFVSGETINVIWVRTL